MTLLDPRSTFRPFHYPFAFEYYRKAHESHWLPTEVSIQKDIQQYKTESSESEKRVIANVLRVFTQVEIGVAEYWSGYVGKVFAHPEVQMMANTFSSFEAIHTHAYSYLSDSLGFGDDFYAEFKDIAALKEKLPALTEDKDVRSILKNIGIFSAFTEGVQLFSSFAILASFSTLGKFMGVKNIIKWSVRDESMHSEAGCQLFRQLVSEFPDVWDDDLKKSLYEAARRAVSAEDAFIDYVFEGCEPLQISVGHSGEIATLDAHDLKTYIRHRANVKLGDIGLKKNWKNLQPHKCQWFDEMFGSGVRDDFFAVRSTSYSKATVDFSNIKVTSSPP